jgi:hypothetical protein
MTLGDIPEDMPDSERIGRLEGIVWQQNKRIKQLERSVNRFYGRTSGGEVEPTSPHHEEDYDDRNPEAADDLPDLGENG